MLVAAALHSQVSGAPAPSRSPKLSSTLPLSTVQKSGWLPTETGQPGQPPYFIYLPQVKLYRQGRLLLVGQAYALSKQGSSVAQAEETRRVPPQVRIKDLASEQALLGIKPVLAGDVLIWAHPASCPPCAKLMTDFNREVLAGQAGQYQLVDVTVD
ncbi:hypothetical protein ACS5PK_13525 [Roseateles sp. DB2]|uniref:hypothetical protein n=1 Tax=Roseateles sp. DB2 TaxID=3453717 RepID=UPI003EEB4F98